MPAPTRYRTLNWSSYNAALRERGSLMVWFDPSTPWHAAPSGKRGAQPVYSDATIQACLAIKVLFGLPLRQTTGFVASLLKLTGLDWLVLDFSTLCRRQKTLAVQLPYRGSGGPLHLLIDSTGIKSAAKASGMSASMAELGGVSGTRSTLQSTRQRWKCARSISPIAKSAMRLCCLAFCRRSRAMNRSRPSSQMAPTMGVPCRDAIALRGAEAVISPRRNAKPWKKDSPGARGRNDDLRAMKRFGRTLWRKWSGYHRRSRVETKMNCMKLLGQRLMSRDFDRQTAELQVRIAILNRFTALDIPVTKPVD